MSRKDKAGPRIIHPGMTPGELDVLLWEEYGHGLYSFTFSLAEAVFSTPIFGEGNIWRLRSIRYAGYKELMAEIERLESIKARAKKFLKPLKLHFRKLPDWFIHGFTTKDKRPKEVAQHLEFYKDTSLEEDMLLRAYKLDGFIETLEKELGYLKSCLVSNYQKRPGKAVQTGVILNALWSLVMRKDKNADKKNVKALVTWFAGKLKKTDYENQLRLEHGDRTIYGFLLKHERLLKEAKEFYFPIEREEHIRPDHFQFDFSQPQLEIKAYSFTCERAVVPLIIFHNRQEYCQEFVLDQKGGKHIPVRPSQS